MSQIRVPRDWDELTLAEIGVFKNGINKGSDSFGHGFPFVNLMDVFGATKLVDTATLGLIDSSETERRTYDLREGDVLFVRSSVKPSGVGLTTLVASALRDTVFSGFLLRFRSDSRLANSFKAHLFSESGFRSRVIGASTVSANTNINQRSLGSLTIRFPRSKTEQQSIAEALSDTDDLIAALERLIAKKEAIKQGLMQQLLSGAIRLPKFNESWADATIGALARVTGGGTPSTRVAEYWGGTIPWFTPAEINASGSGLVAFSERTITSEGLANSSATLLPAGSVLVTSRASIGNCAVAEVPVTTNQGFSSMIPKDPRSTWFLYYWTQQNKSELESRAAGSTFLEISASKVAGIPLQAPSLDEQRAIGEALRDSDLELERLGIRLRKARDIKIGMMQQLLTGRTRLLVETAS